MRKRSSTWKTGAMVAVAASLSVAPVLTPGASAASTTKATSLGSTIESTLWGDDSTKEGKDASKHRTGWDASLDLGSMYSLEQSNGIQDAWSRGVTGNGVTVALIDSGVSPVPGLDRDGKVMDGPDLSYEGQSPSTAYLDSYGHGTHMAGIIAGKDEGFDPKKPGATQFAGVAPDARLLNMKVGTGDGGVDVSQVIAALDWVVQHNNDAGMHVRVVNLAYGTESTQPWQVDPLAKAVEDAWNAGIVVVTAAGNDGPQAPLLMPAIDPHVIAVGAVDHEGTASSTDDQVSDFTSGGTPSRRPDLLAPGKSVVSLRDPGSYVDQLHPEGLVPGDDEGRFFRGSGTSQATAVVAGEVALLLQAKPNLTPDQVKALLRATADRLPQSSNPAQGAGVVDVDAALDLLNPKILPTVLAGLTRSGQPALPASTGTGSLEASRGGEHVVDPSTGDELVGERDAQGNPWNSAAWADVSGAGTAWSKGGVWNGSVWTSDKWKDKAVLPAAWAGSSWNGVPWGAHQWSKAAWESRSWRNDDWRSRSWREDSWQSRSWRSLD
ncbi:MAG: serine protease AprX [Nocardioidaceae bacterium]|nr:serine protease AprX [Nocardioidaceae bacterium]